jgi:C4-dicarboxylate-specific signal transduction histidine kinase
VLASWDRALADAGNYHAVEYRIRQPDGSWRWIAACGRVRFDADRPVRVIAVVQDISARKQAEAELRQLSTELQARVETEVAAREAMQARAARVERMHALGQLAGGIAHDFNTVPQAVAASWP